MTRKEEVVEYEQAFCGETLPHGPIEEFEIIRASITIPPVAPTDVESNNICKVTYLVRVSDQRDKTINEYLDYQ